MNSVGSQRCGGGVFRSVLLPVVKNDFGFANLESAAALLFYVCVICCDMVS
jgi:hypothetical protein